MQGQLSRQIRERCAVDLSLRRLASEIPSAQSLHLLPADVIHGRRLCASYTRKQARNRGSLTNLKPAACARFPIERSRSALAPPISKSTCPIGLLRAGLDVPAVPGHQRPTTAADHADRVAALLPIIDYQGIRRRPQLRLPACPGHREPSTNRRIPGRMIGDRRGHINTFRAARTDGILAVGREK